MNTNPRPRAALSYADRGLRVFPIFEVDAEGRCACGKDCDATLASTHEHHTASRTRRPTPRRSRLGGRAGRKRTSALRPGTASPWSTWTCMANGNVTLAALEAAHGLLPAHR